MFSRVATRTPVIARSFATTIGKGYKEKTIKQVWLSDKGAYPVLACMAFAGVFCAATCVYFMTTMPDVRLAKSSRKSIFRGEELKNIR